MSSNLTRIGISLTPKAHKTLVAISKQNGMSQSGFVDAVATWMATDPECAKAFKKFIAERIELEEKLKDLAQSDPAAAKKLLEKLGR